MFTEKATAATEESSTDLLKKTALSISQSISDCEDNGARLPSNFVSKVGNTLRSLITYCNSLENTVFLGDRVENLSDARDPIGEVVGFIANSRYVMVKIHDGFTTDLGDSLYATEPRPSDINKDDPPPPYNEIESQLRKMLCFQVHGYAAYMDDGKASYCGDEYYPPIDYMLDSPGSIAQKLQDAGRKRLLSLENKSTPVTNPSKSCPSCGF